MSSAASFYLRHAPPTQFRDDCSGFVCAVMQRAGLPSDGNTRHLWSRAKEASAVHRRTRPHIGDLVFFDNTYDRDKNRRFDDDLTHIGVVVSMDEDGTITVAHAGTSRGRSTLTMNLLRPGTHKDEGGKLLNDFLRRRSSSDPANAQYLAGQLWRGFATVRPSDRAAWSR